MSRLNVKIKLPTWNIFEVLNETIQSELLQTAVRKPNCDCAREKCWEGGLEGVSRACDEATAIERH